jgi:hypothetical protein
MTTDIKMRFAKVAVIARAAASDRKPAVDALEEMAILCDEIEDLVLDDDVTPWSNHQWSGLARTSQHNTERNEELARMQKAVRVGDALTVQCFRQVFAERYDRPVPDAIYDEDILRWYSEALGMLERDCEFDANNYVIGRMRNWN